MDERVIPLTRRPDRPPSGRWGSRLGAVLLVGAGIAFGYLLAQGSTGSLTPVEPESFDVVTTAPAVAEAPVDAAVRFSGTILASVEFGRGLVTWPGDRDPIKIGLATDVTTAAYDAAKGRLAVTLLENGGDALALHMGSIGDLRFVASGVTGFAWHPEDPNAIAWVAESADGFALVAADIVDGVVTPRQITLLPEKMRPVAWGSWGYALEGSDGLTTFAPSGAVLASDDLQLVAAGSDGRLIVARPAGTPLSSDWAITGPDLAVQQPLGRFSDSDEHPTAAAILPQSGRIVLVSNRFGDGTDLAHVEVLAADGTREAVFRSGMIADSIAWSADEARLAVGGYYYGSNQVRSVVLLASSDGTGDPVEVPFDHEVQPLGLRN